MCCDPRRGRRRLAADRGGNVMIEFALGLPVLLILLAGLLDLGRYSLQKSAMAQGARAGAQYGMIAYADSASINATAQAATGLSGVTASTTVFCECVSGTTVSCGTTCSAGATLKRYVTVTTTKSFASVVPLGRLDFGSFGGWTAPTSVSESFTTIVP